MNCRSNFRNTTSHYSLTYIFAYSFRFIHSFTLILNMEITPGLANAIEISYGDTCSWQDTETKLSILIINAHSLRNKLTDLEAEIRLYGNPSIVVVSETWLTEGLRPFFCINGYTVYHTVRSDGYGGMSVYVLDTLSHTATTDLSCIHEVHLTRIQALDAGLSVLCVYRAPRRTNVNAFLDMIDPLLEQGSNIIMCGDMNFNLLSSRDDVLDFVNTIESNSYAFLNSLDEADFTFPGSQSILDLFLTDMIDNQYHVKNNPSISDHHACLLLMRGSRIPPLKNVSLFKHNPRIVSALRTFLRQLSNQTLSQIHAGMTELVSRNTFKMRTIGRVKLPWIDNELLQEMRKRDELYGNTRSPLITESERNRRKDLYRTQKNRVTMILRRKRNNFIETHIQSSMNDSRKMWQVMKMVIRKHPTNQNEGIPKIIEKDDGNTTSDPKLILDLMNEHFSNVGEKINVQTKILNNNRPRNALNLNMNNASIYLYDTNQSELYSIIKSLKNDAAAGLDGLSVKNIKTIAYELSQKLVRPINLCMRNGEFPQSFKEARIKALYKGKGSRKKCTNYRPISVLSNLSKIYEKLLYLRLYRFLTETSFIASTQFGFLPHSSTTTAALHAITRIRQSLDDGRCTAAVFIDVAKAFDSVDHNQLLKKLDIAGISGKANMIIQDYLFARRQKIIANDLVSNDEFIRFGIPQGSNLSSLLFLIYVNDCLNLPLNGYIQMYADDTILTYSCGNPFQLHAHIEEDLTRLNNWMYDNYLSFNADKTNYMLFRTSSQSPSFTIPPIHVNQSTISETSSTRYLGLTIDNNLSWSMHIQALRSQLSPYLFVLRNAKYVLSRRIKLSLYYSYIHSHLSYLVSIWGYAKASHLRQLQIIQNKAIRSLFWQEYRRGDNNTQGLLRKYRIPNIEQLTLIDSLLLIFKVKNGLIRNNMQLTTFEEVHDHDTRNKRDFIIPRTRTSLLYNSIFAKGLTQFNALPRELKNIGDILQFKKAVKNDILQDVTN